MIKANDDIFNFSHNLNKKVDFNEQLQQLVLITQKVHIKAD